MTSPYKLCKPGKIPNFGVNLTKYNHVLPKFIEKINKIKLLALITSAKS